MLRLVTFFLLLSAPLLQAELSWKSTSFNVVADPAAETTDAVYQFENTGITAVEIVAVDTSCGCTAAEPEKKIYQPGESGEIKAVFTHGNRLGLQHKTLTVRTMGAGKTDEYILSLQVQIPELLSNVEPRMLSWRLNGPEDPQTLQVRLDTNFPIKVKDATVIGPRASVFEVLGIENLGGGLYEIYIKPTTTDTPASGSLRITTDYPAGNPRTAHAILRVR